MTPDELARIEERYAVWKRGAMAGIDPEGYERWSEARSQLYYFDVPALIAALRDAQGRERELSDLLREAYGYTPECTGIAEDIAELFPDIARPRDLPQGREQVEGA